jgi:STE24 endopeptidase
MENKDNKAKRYNQIKIKITIAGIVLDLLFLIILLFTGLSVYIRSLVESSTSSFFLTIAVYSLIIGFFDEIISLPLHFYSGYFLEHKFEMSNQGIKDWIVDQLKSLGLTIAIGLPLVLIFYFILKNFNDNWWILTGIVFTVLFVLLAKFAPLILFPVFFKFKPLENENLKERLIQLCEKVGTKINGVFEMDLSKKSKSANAGLAGTGKTRRIILSDTLLNNFSEDEIESIMAHELGHHIYKHMLKGLILQTVFIFFGFFIASVVLKNAIGFFGFRTIYDVAGLPLIILVVSILSVILLPIVNSISRKMELQADAYACRMSSNPQAFLAGLEKLANLNLADRNPNPIIEFIFYSHPSIERRLRFGQKILETTNQS